MPIDTPRLSRRSAARAAALGAVLAAGAGGLVSGCDDSPDRTGTPGLTEAPNGTRQPAPSTDPAVVAALRTAATQIQQVSQRYAAISQAHPGLRSRLTAGIRFHASQVARLKQLGAFQPGRPGKLPPVPGRSAAAVADLVAREQRLSVAHAAAATKVSGPAARLLASIAASESQLAATLAGRTAR